jgi:Rrf2 family protein
MIKPSKKLALAVEAVVDIAYHGTAEPVQSQDIGRRLNLPRRYLEQVMQQLVKAGILKGVRGPRGGYRLARPPEEISVAEVVACLEGETASERRADPGTPEFSVVAGLEAALARRRQELLAARSLDQLLRERQVLGDASVMYFI